MKKIVRTICYFSKEPSQKIIDRLKFIESELTKRGYEIQTRRICSSNKSFTELKNSINDNSVMLSIGSLNFKESVEKINDFIKTKNVSFNLDLTNDEIKKEHAEFLFKIIKESPESTFSFAYTFNNSHSSPFFPSATYEKEGFVIGLQSTNLSEGCKTIEEWLGKMKTCWLELDHIFKNQKDYLGIDSSVAPLFKNESSLINFIKKFKSFNESVLTDTYLKITKFIKKENPRPIGLCGLMFPCLEDFELAEEYEKGNFSIERNIYLSLHSGLGIDTYPLGIDEEIRKVIDILKTIQCLSKKYKKPLSVRFVSDGKSKILDKTSFKNQYMMDVLIKRL